VPRAEKECMGKMGNVSLTNYKKEKKLENQKTPSIFPIFLPLKSETANRYAIEAR